MATDEFGKAVFTLEVDKNFPAQLKTAEVAADKSSSKMATSLSKVSTASTVAGSSLNKTSAAAASLGAAGAATGSSIAALAGQMVSLAASGGLATVTLAGFVTVIGLLAAGFRRAAETSKMLKEAEEARAEQARENIILDLKQVAVLDKLRDAARQSFAVEFGGRSKSSFIDDAVLRNIEKRRENLLLIKRVQESSERLDIAGFAVKRSILDVVTERLAKEREILKAKQAQDQIDKTQRRAGLRAGTTPARTLAEAETTIVAAVTALRANERSQRLQFAAMSTLLREGILTVNEAQKLSGLAFGPNAMGGVSGGAVAAGAFTGGTGVVTASPAVKTNKLLENQLKVSKQQVELLKAIAANDGSMSP